MKTIGIMSTKGGVGKSTLTCSLGVEATKEGKRVLLIDADVQGSVMGWYAAREKKDNLTAISINQPTISDSIKNFTDFDLCIVDSGGRDNDVFRDALFSCDAVFIPTTPSVYDLWAASDSIKILKEARITRKQLQKPLPAYFILNMLIPSTNIGKDFQQALNDFSEDVQLLNSHLTARVSFKESIAQGLNVTELEPTGKGAGELKSLYTEIMDLLKKG